MNKFMLLVLAVTLVSAFSCNEGDDGDEGDVACADVLEPDATAEVSDCTEHDVLPAGACRTQDDCTDGRHCFAPDDKNCGICMELERPCEGDDNCTEWPGTVCDYPIQNDCYCDSGKHCMPECGITDGTVCDSKYRPTCIEGRCVARPCDTDVDCPGIFFCAVTDAWTGCEPRTCLNDQDCGDCGWCVNGMCYDEPGTCEYMAP